ncbi:hypothetical protein [Cryobacterium sp. LW097]|uniref:hypothetical protein n=1 Tax=Cryobacterium sp. LW097 TaxID=1978566 RepID=UPI001248D16E|nr:hypothetical protein [Cryobacterium sp. LW097]
MRSIKDLTSVIDCSVVHCEGLAFDHESDDPRLNLHRVSGPELESVPMTINYVMQSNTWPRWVIDVDAFHQDGETTPAEASLMALYLSRAALLCIDMNEAHSAAGWA